MNLLDWLPLGVQETTQGSDFIFRHAAVKIGIVALIGLACLAASRWRSSLSSRMRLGFLAAGLLILGFFGPMLFLERVVIRSEGFIEHVGFFGCTSIHEVRFADVESIRVTREVTKDGHVNTFLFCARRDGGEERVPAGSDLMKSALPRILAAAKARGIPVEP